MFYKIKLESKAKKFISKLDSQQKSKVIKFVDSLAKDPFPKNKNPILESSGSSLLCELAVEKIRIYYTIENQFVVIEDVEFDGVVGVLERHNNHKSGNSNNPNQQKTIKRLKKFFKL